MMRPCSPYSELAGSAATKPRGSGVTVELAFAAAARRFTAASCLVAAGCTAVGPAGPATARGEGASPDERPHQGAGAEGRASGTSDRAASDTAPAAPSAGGPVMIVDGPGAAAGGPAARGTWHSAGSKVVDLGRLDCYSQAELDACAAKKQGAPAGTCDVGGRAGAVSALVEAGMNCSQCFTDCHCRGVVATFTCQ